MFGVIVMGARQGRRAAHAVRHEGAVTCAVARYVDAVRNGAPDARTLSPDARSLEGAEASHRRRGPHTARREANSEAVKNIIAPIENVESSSPAFDWIWKRRWRLDKKEASRLAYQLKTRAITVILISLGLQLPGFLSSKAPIITLAITVAGVNWVAEYFKNEIGSQGVSITFGFRWVARVIPTPWLIAVPRK